MTINRFEYCIETWKLFFAKVKETNKDNRNNNSNPNNNNNQNSALMKNQMMLNMKNNWIENKSKKAESKVNPKTIIKKLKRVTNDQKA